MCDVLTFLQLDAKKIGHSFYGFSRKKDFYHKLNKDASIENGMTINNIKHMLNASLISKNDKQFEKILQCLNEKEINTLKESNEGKEMMSYFSTNTKEMKWKKGEKLLNSFLNSL